jgi:hypothetical protein
MVWRQIWPAVKDKVFCQWRKAKIVPLKKPGKID